MIVGIPHGSFNISALCPSDVPAPRESIKICALLSLYIDLFLSILGIPHVAN